MAKKVDQNQSAIVAALRQVGCAVADTHTVGHGFPDLVVYYPRTGLHLLEVKGPNGTLTADERDWHARWPGVVHVVRTVTEALEAIGAKWSE